MASTLSDSEIEAIIEEAQKAVSSDEQHESLLKMDKAIEMMQFAKYVVEAELKKLHEEIESKLAYLVKHSAIKAEASRRVRATKVAMASLAISVSSLTFGIRCSAISVMRDALPWAFGLSATSLLFSFIYCKGIWRNFKRKPSSEIVEKLAKEIQGKLGISSDPGLGKTNQRDSSVETGKKPKERVQRRVVSA